MKKKATLKNKKLKLNRETLRALKQQDLVGIAGGVSALKCTVSRCDATCPTC